MHNKYLPERWNFVAGGYVAVSTLNLRFRGEYRFAPDSVGTRHRPDRHPRQAAPRGWDLQSDVTVLEAGRVALSIILL